MKGPAHISQNKSVNKRKRILCTFELRVFRYLTIHKVQIKKNLMVINPAVAASGFAVVLKNIGKLHVNINVSFSINWINTYLYHNLNKIIQYNLTAGRHHGIDAMYNKKNVEHYQWFCLGNNERMDIDEGRLSDIIQILQWRNWIQMLKEGSLKVSPSNTETNRLFSSSYPLELI